MEEKHTLFGSGINRLEALTDGVFAIVMTLMVFNISLPRAKEITAVRAVLMVSARRMPPSVERAAPRSSVAGDVH